VSNALDRAVAPRRKIGSCDAEVAIDRDNPMDGDDGCRSGRGNRNRHMDHASNDGIDVRRLYFKAYIATGVQFLAAVLGANHSESHSRGP